jgi:hypothetical protein
MLTDMNIPCNDRDVVQYHKSEKKKQLGFWTKWL